MNIIKQVACIVIAASGCAAVKEAVDNAQPQPRDGFELEETISSKDNELQTRLRLTGEKSDYFRVLHTDSDSGAETLVGARADVDFPFYEGKIVLFGQSTSDNDAVGVNIDGKIIIPELGDILLGIAVERDSQPGNVRNLRAFYLGRDFEDDLVVKLGMSDIDGVQEYTGHLNKTSGRNVFGAALTLDENSDGFLTLSVGRMYDAMRGNGFGCRLWARTDFDQANTADLMLTTNTNLAGGSILGPVAIQDGMHDPSIFPNVMDYVPGNPTLLDERIAPGGVALRLKYSGTETGETVLVAARYNFPGSPYPMVGADWEISNPDTGEITHAVTPRVGMRWKNASIDYACICEQDKAPEHELKATVGFRF